MFKKIVIALSFMTALRGLALLSDTAFAATQENGQPCPPECLTDSMEIVTWYPSPYNEYEELRLYPKHSAAESQCNSFEQLGLMYYNQDEYALKICRQDPDTLSYGWEKIGEGLWKLSGADIFNTNSGGVNVNGNIQDGSVVIYDTTTNKIRQETLPFKKGDLIAPGDRPLISSGANYTTDYFSIQNLGISGLSASNVKQGVRFGPGNSIEGTAAFTAPAFILTGGNVQCPAGYKMISRYWNNKTCNFVYTTASQCNANIPSSCNSGGGWSETPVDNTCYVWSLIGPCDPCFNTGCSNGNVAHYCQSESWSQAKCEPE